MVDVVRVRPRAAGSPRRERDRPAMAAGPAFSSEKARTLRLPAAFSGHWGVEGPGELGAGPGRQADVETRTRL